MTDRKEPIGSVAEEALKLLAALQGWARDGATEGADLTSGAAAFFTGINEHLATDATDCKYCPICRTVSVLREASPEVRHHLSLAATSLLHAAAGWAASASHNGTSRSSASAPIEKITIDDEDSD